MIRRFVLSWRHFWRVSLVLALPAVVIAVVLGQYVDAELAAYFKPRYGSPVHLFSIHTTDVGKADFYFIVSGLAAAVLSAGLSRGWLAPRWRSDRAWALGSLTAFFVSGALVQIIKHLVGRARPYADHALSSFSFAPLTQDYEFHSFPSGHAQVLFTAATLLSLRFSRLSWLWYTVATLFAATRVITLNHWLSDVVVGAIVGTMGTLLTVRLLAKTKAAF